MRVTSPAAWLATTVVPTLLATAMLAAQGTQPPPPSQQTISTKTVNYKSIYLLARDAKGRFVPTLTKDDFELYEDGVPQRIEVFYPVIGGRPQNAPLASAPSRPTGGLILPSKARTQNDTSGRVFVILIDDMAILGQDSMQARQVLKQIRDHLVQDNDLIGIVSSGYSSIEVDLTYDYGHVRLDEAINKTMGSGMTPDEIITATQTSEGPAGLRYMAHTAMKTAKDILDRAAALTDRRKAFIYVSSGYDFDPFRDSRLKYQQELYSQSTNQSGTANSTDPTTNTGGDPNSNNDPYIDPFLKNGNKFAEGDLVADMAEIIRAANRANMSIYAIDPRGLIAGPDIGANRALTSTEWNDYIHSTTNSLIALSDNTGGFAIVNTNDFLPGLEKINNETSDYYMLGYNSTNQDPFKIRRKVEIRSKKTGLTLNYPAEYTLPRPKRGK